MSKRFTPLAVVLSLIPLLACAVAFAFLPETIPVHFDSSGAVDRYGSRAAVFLLGGIMTLANLLCAACFHFADKLAAWGLLHAPSVGSGRAIFIVCIVFCDVMALVVLTAWLFGIS